MGELIFWKQQEIERLKRDMDQLFRRLLYVEKVLYENYKDFLFKPYKGFRRQGIMVDWMKEH